jgi:hypothetical protein
VWSVVVDDDEWRWESGDKHRRRESRSVCRHEADRQEGGRVWRVEVISRGMDTWVDGTLG